ncbi:MAG: arylsulfatase, partial [Saprospiraceae bacterium]|nr:arylsulfatase [Saprospiraceae bacterium]
MRHSIWLSVVLLVCQQPMAGTQILRPNILLILVDDLGYGDLSLAANPAISTPNLDRLAAESVHFTEFYVSPVCAPTRASLLTGRYHQRTGVQSVTNGYETINPDETTLAEILKSTGYRTGIFGKWHLGEYYPSLPNAQGFDEYIGFRTGHTDKYFNATLEKNGRAHATYGYITDVLTQEAFQFIKTAEKQPFFCYLAYNAPHTPLQIDSSWFAGHLKQGLPERTARVYGLIENLDQNIGSLLDSLASHNLTDNTIVIFLSDNGPISGWQLPQDHMRYNAGLRDQKFTIYEGGIRTHCFWSWPGRWPSSRRSDVFGAHIDVVPTLLEVLQIANPLGHQIDGISLKSTLEGSSENVPMRTFFQKYALGTFDSHWPYPGGIARKGDWKMVNGTELYDLEADPGEQRDLAAIYPDTLRKLDEAYHSWWQSILSGSERAKANILVGHLTEEIIELQPHHGIKQGNITFTGKRGLTGEKIGTHPSGVDGDWLAGWEGPDDGITWPIDVQANGKY